jgi:hypothetical protein
MQLVRKFVENIQRRTEPPAAELDTYQSFQESVGAATVWERGEWIDGEKLERDLSGWLEYAWYFDSPDLSQRTRIDGILRRRARFVALVDEDRRFWGLVDRCAMLSHYVVERDGNESNLAAQEASR